MSTALKNLISLITNASKPSENSANRIGSALNLLDVEKRDLSDSYSKAETLDKINEVKALAVSGTTFVGDLKPGDSLPSGDFWAFAESGIYGAPVNVTIPDGAFGIISRIGTSISSILINAEVASNISEWTAKNYNAGNTVIKDNYLYYVAAGQNVYPTDIPGISTKWVRLDKPLTILNPSNSLDSISSQGTDLYLKKIGVKENGKPTIYIDDTLYTDAGKAVLIGSGNIAGEALLNSTDFIELPLGWGSINFYQPPTNTYGLAFYDSNKTFLGGSNYAPVQDSYMTLNKSDNAAYPRARYIKHTKYATGNFALKNRLLIINNNSLPLSIDAIVKNLDYDKWKIAQENAGNTVAEYNFDLLNIQQTAGVKKIEYLDIQNFTEFYISLLQSNLYKISLFDSSFTKLVDISADLDLSQNYKVVKTSDYPTARYITIYGLDSIKDKFKFSVGFPKNNKQVDGEGKIKTVLNLRGKVVEYLDFNDSDFPLIGQRRLVNGSVDASFTTHRATNLIRLPENWQYIQYDALLSSTYGLVFFDINKKFIKGISNPSVTFQGVNTVNYFDVPNAYYFAYSYTSTFRSLNFRIVSNRTLETKELQKFEGRISNLDISDFDKWNLENPANKVTKEVIFDSTTVSGKPYPRIPGAIVTNALTYIGATEVRSTPADIGNYDLYINRKAQGGSWQTQNVFPYDSASYGRCMNPSFIVDRTGAHGTVGRIYLFVATVKDPNKLAYDSPASELDLLYKFSDDDGLTWSAAQSLKSLWGASYKASLVAPDNGIQLTNGTFVIPCMGLIGTTWFSGIAYKKVGENWVFSELTPHTYDNESAVVEFQPNRVLLNCRTDPFGTFTSRERSVYEYDFTLNKFLSHESDKTFNGFISCQGSMLKIKVGTKDIFLFSYCDKSNIANPQAESSRYNQTIWASIDCKKWIRVYVANHAVSWGYGVMSFYNGKLIYVYEAPNFKIEIQDLTPLLNKIDFDVTVNINLSAEEKLNRLIYKQNNWIY